MAELPYVSRSALKRVKDKMPIPECCPNCESNVSLVEHTEVYGRNYGDWPYLYKCDDDNCDSFVGLHPNTDLPLGTLANAELRSARKEAKALFMEDSKAKGYGRSKAYRMLAERLNMPVRKCHFAWFDVERCKQVVALYKNAPSSVPSP